MQKVLVLENQPDFLHTVSDHLKVAGYQPVGATTPNEADVLLSRERFLAAVVDVRMRNEADPHDWSGLIKARFIAEHKVPVIILSAYDSPEDIERAYTVSLEHLAPRKFISKNSPDWNQKLIEVLAEISKEQHRGIKVWLQTHWQDLVSFVVGLWRKIFP